MTNYIVKSSKTSDGHPFISNPDAWVGTPWDESRDSGTKKGNAELVAELHERLRSNQNVSDLFSEKHRATSLGASGKKPVFENNNNKLSVPSAPTPSNQQTINETQDINPFSEAVKARAIPLEMVLPISWTLPHGFSVKHLDGSHYLPLFAHGLRETKEFLGVSMGDIAAEAFHDVARIHGKTGRVFRQIRIIMLAIRPGILFSAASSTTFDDAFKIGRRIMTCLNILVTCDDTDYLRGSNAGALFSGTHPPFNLIAAPLVAFRVRVINSKEYIRKDPRFTDMANQIFQTMSLIEDLGGSQAKKIISSAFPSGFTS
mmetsp:Transcript_37424/g.48419  ORF Transcript_37424/g.48419 Transcript_37424/m.48419 type:complete len:316 (+) Transcript_37424:72-1019(+)